MRLINENEVIKYVDKNTNDDSRLNDDISCILEKIPTAYDVNKVIKRLEDLICYLLSEVDKYDEAGRSYFVEIYVARVEAYKHAIKIVKSGGVTDE